MSKQESKYDGPIDLEGPARLQAELDAERPLAKGIICNSSKSNCHTHRSNARTAPAKRAQLGYRDARPDEIVKAKRKDKSKSSSSKEDDAMEDDKKVTPIQLDDKKATPTPSNDWVLINLLVKKSKPGAVEQPAQVQTPNIVTLDLSENPMEL